MGSCGCVDGFGDVKFQGPGDSFYTLAVYPGCRYCDEAPGFILSHIKKEDPYYDELRDIPTINIGVVFGLMPFDLSDVRRKLKKLYEKESEAAQMAVEDLADTELLPAMQDSCREMAVKWKATLTYPESVRIEPCPACGEKKRTGFSRIADGKPTHAECYACGHSCRIEKWNVEEERRKAEREAEFDRLLKEGVQLAEKVCGPRPSGMIIRKRKKRLK